LDLALLGNHHAGITDLDLSVHDRPVGALEARMRYLCVECPLQKVYHARRVTHDQVGSDRVMTGGNRIYCHSKLLASRLQLASLDHFAAAFLCKRWLAHVQRAPMCNVFGPTTLIALSLGP